MNNDALFGFGIGLATAGLIFLAVSTVFNMPYTCNDPLVICVDPD
jgi:hypothetical protein